MATEFEVGGPDLESIVRYDAGEYFGEFTADFDSTELEATGSTPTAPTEAKPGSEQKVQMLAARYAAGLPLWHDEDCYDHGPGLETFEEDEFEMEEEFDLV